MIGAVVLVLMALLIWVAIRRTGEPLSPGERRFLVLAPLPPLVAFGIPAFLVLAGRQSAGKATLADPAVIVGLIGSAFLTAIGIHLLTRPRQGARIDARLALGLVVAALPMLLTGFVALLYAII